MTHNDADAIEYEANVDKILFKNRYIALIDRNGYTFTREIRCGGIIVAILPFRMKADDVVFLARVEVCPAHGNKPERCCITGGLERNETVKYSARRELVEEAGFQIDEEDFIELGTVRPSKSSDTVAHLFAVDVSQKIQLGATGDGTPLELNASVEWVNYETGLTNKDPFFIVAMTRLLYIRRNVWNFQV